MAQHEYTRGERQRANNVLRRMDEIAANEMMAPGKYVSNVVVNPKLAAAGAICQGHQACAIGSFMLAAGQRLQKGVMFVEDIYGSDPEERESLLQRDPGLRLAFAALNQAAELYEELHDDVVIPVGDYDNPLENLFEGSWENASDRELKSVVNAAMREVIADARRRVRES